MEGKARERGKGRGRSERRKWTEREKGDPVSTVSFPKWPLPPGLGQGRARSSARCPHGWPGPRHSRGPLLPSEAHQTRSDMGCGGPVCTPAPATLSSSWTCGCTCKVLGAALHELMGDFQVGCWTSGRPGPWFQLWKVGGAQGNFWDFLEGIDRLSLCCVLLMPWVPGECWAGGLGRAWSLTLPCLPQPGC